MALQRRTQAERSQETQLKICEATLEALVEVGYEKISTPLIAQKAKVSRGALTHQFPKRNDLLVAAFEYLVNSWRQGYPFNEETRPEEVGVVELIDALWENIFEKKNYAAALELMLAARQDNDLGLALRDILTGWIRERDEIAVELTALSGLGEEADAFIQLNLSVLRGIAMHQSFDRDSEAMLAQLNLWRTIARQYYETVKKTR